MAAFERFYEAEYPPVDSVVMAKIISIGETMFQAKLLEYDKTAFILRSCILGNGRLVRATRRSTAFKLGDEVPRHVLRVEPSTDFIDLSSKGLPYEEARYHKEQYHKSKMVVSILRHTCIQMNLDEKSCENLVRNTSWYFDKKFDRRGKTYEIFQGAASNPCVLDECDIDTETRATLLRVIRLKFAPKLVALRSVVEVTCFTYEGIDAIKRALREGLSVAIDSCPLEVGVTLP
ncbi:eukaryotic translation initiation factor 2 subunit 1-like [Liolophura sinensis]|uniref:eukaryotic translation initiation factor 2 subunit 1-like n=1 Tax=Liolophura sinensis TaxID=3198878 RepID=UPI003158ACD5